MDQISSIPPGQLVNPEDPPPEAPGGVAIRHLQQIGPDRTNGRPLSERGPVPVPPLNIGLPAIPLSQYEQSDNSLYYPLARGCVNNAGYLTASAAQALKLAHPDMFGSFPDHPSNGDAWDLLMRFRGENEDRCNIVAHFILQAKLRGQLEEVLTEPDRGWYAVEVADGYRRTGSVRTCTIPAGGEYIFSNRDEYRAKKANERLQAEVDMLNDQFTRSVTLFKLLHQTVSDPYITAEMKVGMLRRVFDFAANQDANNAVTYEDLIKVHGQISGGYGLRAEASLEPPGDSRS